MNSELIAKTEAFLKRAFAGGAALRRGVAKRDYRVEHSYRVANIARRIAEREGFDVTAAVIAGLLHDIAYCEEMPSEEEWKNHGRRGAEMVRPFLESLGLDADAVNDICYGIATHVDGRADFEWRSTPFSETVSDADNIDRFDAYRIYELLQYRRFSELCLDEKEGCVEAELERLARLKKLSCATRAAEDIRKQRLDYYISFYERLKEQLENSRAVL